MEICAIVPSYNPDEKLLEVVNGLKGKGIYKIIIVDDGSADKHYFKLISKDCEILTHEVNKGKGRAIKTAFSYYLDKYSNVCKGVVILDGDNQHAPDDVCKCCNLLLKDPEMLVLGVRDFDEKNVPFKSRAGNKITSFVFKVLCGISISDTQTGLRAIGNNNIRKFIEVKGERFEYETNMLLETKKQGIDIVEQKIATIYIDDNKTSHFNPFRDGISIYKVLLTFMSSSMMSLLIDLGIYLLLVWLLSSSDKYFQLLLATIFSRVTSSLFNFFMNHKIVFRSKDKVHKTMIKYYILATLQMFASYGGVYIMSVFFNWNELVIKLIVDGILFFLSFNIQREWVFKKTNTNKQGE